MHNRIISWAYMYVNNYIPPLCVLLQCSYLCWPVCCVSRMKDCSFYSVVQPCVENTSLSQWVWARPSHGCVMCVTVGHNWCSEHIRVTWCKNTLDLLHELRMLREIIPKGTAAALQNFVSSGGLREPMRLNLWGYLRASMLQYRL